MLAGSSKLLQASNKFFKSSGGFQTQRVSSANDQKPSTA